MKIALVTNALDWPTRGNCTTVRRWMSPAAGVEVVAVPPDADGDIGSFDIVHGYHARHGGIAARALARRFGLPLVVSVGGTDLDERGEEIDSVLLDADIVTGAFPSFERLLPEGVRRYVVVPRGIGIPKGVEPRLPGGVLRALLPAGMREVKDPLLAIDLAFELVRRGLPLTLRILGPVVDPAYGARVAERARGLDFVEVGEVDSASMAQAYHEADVVWNTSRFEGGSNALLEAAAHGCARFGRDVPGNRDMLEESELFEPDDFDHVEAFHRALLSETPADRLRRLGKGQAMLRSRFSPDAETAALRELWRSLRPGA